MKKIIFSFLLMLSLVACDNKQEVATKDKLTIKIGATLPLSGDSAVSGVAAKTAMEMVLSELRDKDLKFNYELVFENNEDSTRKTASTTHKLVGIDKVDAVFSLWNYMGSVVASIANTQKVINMTCSWEDPSLVGPYTFNAISTNDQIASLLVDTLKEKGVKSVAMLVDNSGETIIKLVAQKLQEAQIEIVFNEISNMGNNNYKMEIIKASQKNPDMYVIIGAPPMPYLFVKQLSELTGKKNVTGVDGFMEMNDKQRHIANGLWYIDSNVNGTKEFAERMLKKTGIETQSCAGNLAANLQILVHAYENIEAEKGVVPNSDDVVKYIQNNTKNFMTVSGSADLIKDNIINIKPLVRAIKDGRPVDVKPIN